MAAFTYRMGAGSPGDVTRIHPSSIRAFMNDASGSNPATLFGQAVLFHGATNTVRAVDHTDDSGKGATSVDIVGVTVRPYPTQDNGSGETFGAAAFNASGPTAGQVVDVLTQGSILVAQNQPTGTYAATSVLGGTVYVRVTTATTPSAFTTLPVGGFESVQDPYTTNQLIVDDAYWMGGADSFGVAEIVLVD
jgi:hypothetical protein